VARLGERKSSPEAHTKSWSQFLEMCAFKGEGARQPSLANSEPKEKANRGGADSKKQKERGNTMLITPKWFAIGALSGLLVGMVQRARAQAEAVAVVAAVEAAQKISAAYKHMMEFLQSGDPTPEDKILAQLATIQSEIQGIDSQLQALDQDLAQLVAYEKRADSSRCSGTLRTMKLWRRPHLSKFWSGSNRAGPTCLS
jgi:hypothetical protein